MEWASVYLIEQEVSNGEPGVAVFVEDTGTGVPPELREQIFNPFFTSKKDGVGLGLSDRAGSLERRTGRSRVRRRYRHRCAARITGADLQSLFHIEERWSGPRSI